MLKDIIARYRRTLIASNSTAEKIKHAINFYHIEAQKATERANEIYDAWEKKDYQTLVDLGVLTQREYNELDSPEELENRTASVETGETFTLLNNLVGKGMFLEDLVVSGIAKELERNKAKLPFLTQDPERTEVLAFLKSALVDNLAYDKVADDLRYFLAKTLIKDYWKQV